MLILNFAHPITPAQLHQIEQLSGQPVDQILDIPSQIDVMQPLVPQVQAMLERADLSPAAWQTQPILINPPALNFSAAVLLAELHGRMGYFPPIIRIRPQADAVPRRFEVAEIIDLQGLREQARQTRQAPS